jgi:hypothetical protein
MVGAVDDAACTRFQQNMVHDMSAAFIGGMDAEIENIRCEQQA